MNVVVVILIILLLVGDLRAGAAAHGYPQQVEAYMTAGGSVHWAGMVSTEDIMAAPGTARYPKPGYGCSAPSRPKVRPPPGTLAPSTAITGFSRDPEDRSARVFLRPGYCVR